MDFEVELTPEILAVLEEEKMEYQRMISKLLSEKNRYIQINNQLNMEEYFDLKRDYYQYYMGNKQRISNLDKRISKLQQAIEELGI